MDPKSAEKFLFILLGSIVIEILIFIILVLRYPENGIGLPDFQINQLGSSEAFYVIEVTLFVIQLVSVLAIIQYSRKNSNNDEVSGEDNSMLIQLLDSIDLDIAIFNTSKEYEYVNPHAIKNDEIRNWILGKTDLEYVKFRNHPVEIAEIRNSALEQVLTTGESYSFQETLVDGEGNKHVIFRRLTPILSDNGNIERVIGYGRSLNDLIDMENKLSETEKKYQGLFNDAPIAIALVKNSIIQIVNEKFCEIFGYETMDELIGEHENIIQAEEFHEQMIEYGKSRETGEEAPNQYKILGVRSDGSKFPMEVTVTSIELGSSRSVLVFLTDISEKEELDNKIHEQRQQLFQLQKIETLGALARSIAHDFKNQLMIINGYNELIQDISTNSDIVSNSEAIGKTIKRSNELVNRLLDFSQRPINNIETININDIIDNEIQLISKITPRSVILQSDLCQEEIEIEMDKSHFHQVLLNLILNSVEAKGSNGIITIKSDINRYENGEVYVSIEVMDNGPGVPEDIREDIFVPLFTTKESGSGIGLATVRSILKKYNGEITLDHGYEKGAKFVISIPVDALARSIQSRSPL